MLQISSRRIFSRKLPRTRPKRSLKAIQSRVFQTLARRCSHQLTSNVVAKPTGTPIDRTVHVSLEGIVAIHIVWVHGTKVPCYQISADKALHKNLQPKLITAFMVGLKNRAAAFRVQREINDYKREP